LRVGCKGLLLLRKFLQAMGTHGRLGCESKLCVLPKELIKPIVEACSVPFSFTMYPDIEDPAPA